MVLPECQFGRKPLGRNEVTQKRQIGQMKQSAALSRHTRPLAGVSECIHRKTRRPLVQRCVHEYIVGRGYIEKCALGSQGTFYWCNFPTSVTTEKILILQPLGTILFSRKLLRRLPASLASNAPASGGRGPPACCSFSLDFYEMGLVPKGFFTLPLYTLQIKNQCISISANHWATIQSTSFSCERDMAYSTASLNEANNLSCKGLCSSCTE